MSEKHSSPSSSSNSGPQTPSSQRESGDRPYLEIRQQPPEYVFSEESFTVVVSLEIPPATSPPPKPDGRLYLEFTLLREETRQTCGGIASLWKSVEQPTILVDQTTRECELQCSIRMDNIPNDEDRPLTLRISSADPLDGIGSTFSTSIRVVKYKTEIRLEGEWDTVFYKDEGGRDKAMEIYASVYDRNNRPLTGMALPLHLTLCYHTRDGRTIEVSNQDILTTLGSGSRLQLNADSGEARVRFRIEDVSKNHQNQDFKLKISPRGRNSRDIAPGLTHEVTVKSKRNKKRPRAQQLQPHVPGGTTGSDPRERQQDRELPFDGVDLIRLRSAMQTVIEWSKLVLVGLGHLRWVKLGSFADYDGTSHPHYEMSNPNATIDEIFGRYRDSTYNELEFLKEVIEQATSSRRGEYYPAHPPSSPSSQQYPMGNTARLPTPHPPYWSYSQHHPPHPHPHHPSHPQHPAQAPQAPQSLPRSPQELQHSGVPSHTDSRSGVSSTTFPGPPGLAHYPPASAAPTQQHLPPHYNMGQFAPQHVSQHGGAHLDYSGQTPRRQGHVYAQSPRHAAQNPPASLSPRPDFQEGETRQNEVAFILARQYKSTRTNETLGFPAYDQQLGILGFYRESRAAPGGAEFIPISQHRDDFGPIQIQEATHILREAINQSSDNVFVRADYDSLSALLNRVLVHSWKRGIDG